jgi:tripartite-type tricarboxylate transporter receptor subunit TctC
LIGLQGGVKHVLRGRAALWLLAAIAWVGAPAAAHAQGFPSKPVRLMVGFATGGATDTTARLLAQRWGDVLGQQVVVENRTGAAGVIAAERVAKSPADGYSLLFMPATGAIDPALRTKLPFDLERDFTPVSLVASGPFLLAVHPSVPARDVRDFIALARARPGKLSYGSAGIGSSIHVMAELVNALARIKTLHVPYKGGSEAVIAVASGEVDWGVISIPAAMPLLAVGKLRALGVTSAKRSALMPALPSLNESGVPGYDRTGWFGVMAPAGAPATVISTLNASIAKAVGSASMKEAMGKQGFEPLTSTPAEFAAFIRAEVAQNVKLFSQLGIRAE